jgi:hypothetical protein
LLPACLRVRLPLQAMANVTLEMDGYEGEFLALPLCFHQLASAEPRRYVAAAHSTQPVLLRPAKLEPRELAQALAHVVAEGGERKQLGRHVFVTTLKEEAGSIVLVENASPHAHAHVTIDCEHSIGVLSSRGARARERERERERADAPAASARARCASRGRCAPPPPPLTRARALPRD